jgi:hypothetical protein
MISTKMLRQIALGWLVIGLLGLVVVIPVAINHYAFGARIREAHSGGRLATPAEIAVTLSALGGGAAIFAIAGASILLRHPKE